MSTSTITRRAAAVLLAAGLLLGAAACGSSDGSDGAKAPGGTTAPGDTSAPDSSGGGATDPCQWYTAAEMEALLGFPVAMAPQTVGADEKCVYDAPDNYSSVEITPSDDATYNQQKNYAATPDAVDLAGEVTTYDGIGDEAFGHESKGGVDIDALKGSKSVQVLITNGGGGDTAGNLSTPESTLDIAKQIVTKAIA